MSNIDDLIKAFRSGETRIDLDHAELIFPDSSRVALGVPTFVTLKNRRLRLHLRESAPLELPPFVLSAFAKDILGKVVTAADGLTIEAITDQGIPVSLEGVNPCFSNTFENHISRGGSVTHRRIHFNRLTLLPTGQDGMTPAERRAENIALGIIKPEQTGTAWPEDEEESFFALIPEVKLQLLNSGVTTTTKHPYHRRNGFSGNTACYTGTILNGEFCLEQTDAGDLAVSFRRSSRAIESAPTLQKISEAFMSAVGLLHSCNPWPYYYSQWHERRLVERWIKAPADCQRDGLEPLRVSIMDENAACFFAKAVEFFSTGEADAKYYRQSLWLVHETCHAGAPMEIRLITLCSVLEGVAKRFTKSGNQIGDKAMWKTTIEKAGIPWDRFFDSIYDSYYAYRNKLAHGFDPHPADEQSPELVFNAYSRITAGIYILMAKRMGFTGTLWRSRLEGDATISLAPPPPA